MKAFNKNVIAEFRANKGVVEQFGEGTLLILTTTGARTRQLRRTHSSTMRIMTGT